MKRPRPAIPGRDVLVAGVVADTPALAPIAAVPSIADFLAALAAIPGLRPLMAQAMANGGLALCNTIALEHAPLHELSAAAPTRSPNGGV